MLMPLNKKSAGPKWSVLGATTGLILAAGITPNTAHAATLVHMTFDDVAGTPIASFDLDPVDDLDLDGFPDGDGIFETPSTVDSSGNGHRFLGFSGSTGWTEPGKRLDAVTTTGTGLLSVAHDSNTRDNARLDLNVPVNGLAGGYDTGTATIIIHSWDFSTPLGVGNDPESIIFGFGHESSTNSTAQVVITRDLFGGLLLRADTAGNGAHTGIDPVEMANAVQVSNAAVNNVPLSVSITLDEITDTFRLDYQFLDGVSPSVALFTGGIPGDIRLDPECTGGCPGPFDPDGKRGGYQLRLAFEGNFSDDSFLIDEILVTGTGGPLDGDLNSDGFVGIADLNIVLGVWNQNVTPGSLLDGDPTGDGFVGIADLNVVLGNWNAGTPPAGSAVPEPASITLLGLGGLMLNRRRA
ncbi:MAG: PEP-CTERM sorting domain-containing protein [Phycisphaerales bacterium]